MDFDNGYWMLVGCEYDLGKCLSRTYEALCDGDNVKNGDIYVVEYFGDKERIYKDS